MRITRMMSWGTGLVLALSAAALPAQGMMGGGMMGGRMMGGGCRMGTPCPYGTPGGFLNLTEAQQNSAKAIQTRHQASLAAKFKAAGEAQDALRKAVQDPATPDARVKELHAKAADARVAVMLEHRDMEREFVALLTPDQKSAYEQQRQMGGPRGRGRHHGGWGFGGGF